jgi:predicted ABC-type ATPase
MPRAIFLAGPNGSGKSTLTKKLYEKEPEYLPENFINPDELEVELFDALPPEERRKAARIEGRGRRQQYREAGIDFGLETIFSHPSNFSDIHSLRSEGYTISILVVTTGDAEINVQRVEERKKVGGHGPDAETVRRLYVVFHHLLPRIIEESDEARVYDTTHLERSDPILVFRKQKGRVRAVDAPDYLKTSLIIPLHERAEERRVLMEQFPGITIADEFQGNYSGVLRHCGHFLVQETEGGFVLHDTLLFPNLTASENQNYEFEYNAKIADSRGWPRATMSN